MAQGFYNPWATFRIYMEKLHINKLISGINVVKMSSELVFIRPFAIEDKVEADFYGNQLYEDLYFSGTLRQCDVEAFMLENNLWTLDQEKQLKQFDKDIEQIKVDYYKHFYNIQAKERIKFALEGTKEYQKKLANIRYSFADKTCEYIRDYNKTLFLLERSSFINNELSIKGIVSLFSLMSKYTQCMLNESEIRQIAKSAEWKSIWSVSKVGQQLFSNRLSDLTNEQISLISWSKLYDSIQESIEKPSEEIIEDDIAFDGWLIQQSRTRKEEEKKNSADKMLSDKMSNCSEIILPARDQRDIESIYSLNSLEGKRVLSSTKRDLEKHGEIKESQRTSTRQQIQMQANQMASDRRKK